jgi:hypothetical protein
MLLERKLGRNCFAGKGQCRVELLHTVSVYYDAINGVCELRMPFINLKTLLTNIINMEIFQRIHVFAFIVNGEIFVCFLLKGKVIPLHAMDALGVRGGIAPTHS